MKINWQKCKLEDCLEKIIYTNKIQRKDFLESGNFPIISQEAETINGYWNTKNDLFKIKKPVIIFGDHTQILKYIDFDFVLGADGVKILQPKDSINSRFLYYFLKSITLENLGYARHYRLLKDVEISYPNSLSEQDKIIKTIDEIFNNIAKAKENYEKKLQNAKDLFESYLRSVFVNPGNGWEKKKLGQVCKVTAGQSPEGKFYNKLGKGLPFYQGKKEFGEKYIGEPTTWTTDITKEAVEDDILMSVRAPVGPINFATQNICIGRGLAAIRLNKDVDKDFIFYCILSKEKEIVGNVGAVFASINKNDIENLEFFIPSLSEQKSIITKLNIFSIETKKLESIYKQKLVDLEELKKSVLNKAFKGEL